MWWEVALRWGGGMTLAMVIAGVIASLSIFVKSPTRKRIVVGVGMIFAFLVVRMATVGIPRILDVSAWFLIATIFVGLIASGLAYIPQVWLRSLLGSILVTALWLLLAQAKFRWAWDGVTATQVVISLFIGAFVVLLSLQSARGSTLWVLLCMASAMALAFTGSAILGLQTGFLGAAFFGIAVTQKWHRSVCLPEIAVFLYGSLLLQGIWYSDLPVYMGGVLVLLPISILIFSKISQWRAKAYGVLGGSENEGRDIKSG